MCVVSAVAGHRHFQFCQFFCNKNWYYPTVHWEEGIHLNFAPFQISKLSSNWLSDSPSFNAFSWLYMYYVWVYTSWLVFFSINFFLGWLLNFCFYAKIVRWSWCLILKLFEGRILKKYLRADTGIPRLARFLVARFHFTRIFVAAQKDLHNAVL